MSGLARSIRGPNFDVASGSPGPHQHVVCPSLLGPLTQREQSDLLAYHAEWGALQVAQPETAFGGCAPAIGIDREPAGGC